MNPPAGPEPGPGLVDGEPTEAAVPPARLRALRFRTLAQLWCLVSPVALHLVVRDRLWLSAHSPREFLDAVRIEQWVAVALLALHVRFLVGACLTRRDR